MGNLEVGSLVGGVRDSVTETVVPSCTTPTAFVFLSMWAKWIYISVSGNTVVDVYKRQERSVQSGCHECIKKSPCPALS